MPQTGCLNSRIFSLMVWRLEIRHQGVNSDIFSEVFLLSVELAISSFTLSSLVVYVQISSLITALVILN